MKIRRKLLLSSIAFNIKQTKQKISSNEIFHDYFYDQSFCYFILLFYFPFLLVPFLCNIRRKTEGKIGLNTKLANKKNIKIYMAEDFVLKLQSL